MEDRFLVNFITHKFEVHELVRLVRRMALPVMTDNSTWNVDQQSKLIESMLLRIPLPSFVMDTSLNKWCMVDGLQRIFAIKEFIGGYFCLTNLEVLSEYDSYSFTELPGREQRKIEQTILSVQTIQPGTSQNAKQTIYERYQSEKWEQRLNEYYGKKDNGR